MNRHRGPWSPGGHAERCTRDGAVLLSHNHLAFLQGLLDRPGGRARSKTDLIRAAYPYVERYRGSAPSWWSVEKATRTLPPSLIRWKRKGNRLEFTLRPRGRAVLVGEVRAHVCGMGPYVPASRR